MAIEDDQIPILRQGIETAIRMLSVGDRTETWVDTRGDLDEQYFHIDVFKRDEFVIPPELPPFKQLALSVLAGEPVPPAVLLSALEDAGIYPNGVLAAVENAENKPLDMGNPVYPAGERWEVGDRRFRQVASGWYNGQKAQVFGVCKGLWGRGNAGIGNMFGRFLDSWLGRREPAGPRWYERTLWPTTKYLRDRMATLPPLAWVFRHLRLTAKPATAERLTALIHHLERR